MFKINSYTDLKVAYEILEIAYESGRSQKAADLINAAGALEFLDKTYRPSKDKTIPAYIPEVLKENSRYLK